MAVNQIKALSNYLPSGRLFNGKDLTTTNIYKLLKGLSLEMGRVDGKIDLYRTDILPDLTEEFISEWESALGIPDGCFPATGTLSERRTHVLVKLASLGVQTEQDFIDVAALFGISVTILTQDEDIAANEFTYTFTFRLYSPTSSDDYFTIIVEYVGPQDVTIIECLFDRLKPANCNVIFRET